jgi:hypothetical protein
MKITAARFTVHANAVESTMFRITNALKGERPGAENGYQSRRALKKRSGYCNVDLKTSNKLKLEIMQMACANDDSILHKCF